MNTKLAALILAISLSVASANAALVVDQIQDDFDSDAGLAKFCMNDIAQSFTQGSDNIAGAGFFLQPDTESGDVTISLWNLLPTSGGTQLASGTAYGHGGGWLDVLWSPVTITAGQTYYLVVTSTNDHLAVAGTDNGEYGDGMAFAHIGYTGFSNLDYTFRTYSFEERLPIVPVPEPSTYGLLGALGLAGLIGYRRFEASKAA